MPILIDCGTADQYVVPEDVLRVEKFKKIADESGIPVELRWQPDYDHSYLFVSTFMEEHIAHHARFLTT